MCWNFADNTVCVPPLPFPSLIHLGQVTIGKQQLKRQYHFQQLSLTYPKPAQNHTICKMTQNSCHNPMHRIVTQERFWPVCSFQCMRGSALHPELFRLQTQLHVTATQNSKIQGRSIQPPVQHDVEAESAPAADIPEWASSAAFPWVSSTSSSPAFILL
jgi:hypothetical protein